jgi:hypothetical protein
MTRVHVRFDERGEVVEYELAPSPEMLEEEARRGWRAMMLAPSLEIYTALLRGESVPVEQLDPDWVGRFGRQR